MRQRDNSDRQMRLEPGKKERREQTPDTEAYDRRGRT